MGKIAATAVVLWFVTGCALLGSAAVPTSTVEAGPLGPIIARREGVGPPIECRDVPEAHCLDSGTISAQPGSFQLADVQRVIVSCESQCTDEAGEVRIDVLLRTGRTKQVGNGAYEVAPAPS